MLVYFFLSLFFLAIFQLKDNEVAATELSCGYGESYSHLWPRFKRCRINYKDFPSSAKNESFTLSGSTEEKNEITAVYFSESPSTDFIPLEIFTEFPNIKGILIEMSNIPILKEGFFTNDFKAIQYLNLWYNKITKIEEFALIDLPELKWIYLGSNLIETIKSNIFRNNQKLEFINLESNKIKMIHPYLYVNLNHLVEVWLERNDCINLKFGSPYKSLTTMNYSLKNCHSYQNNHRKFVMD
jgi:carboxypeptidase N regulatory subunit